MARGRKKDVDQELSVLYFTDTWRAVRQDRLNIVLQERYYSESASKKEAAGKGNDTEVYKWRDKTYHSSWEGALTTYLNQNLKLKGNIQENVNKVISALENTRKSLKKTMLAEVTKINALD